MSEPISRNLSGCSSRRSERSTDLSGLLWKLLFPLVDCALTVEGRLGKLDFSMPPERIDFASHSQVVAMEEQGRALIGIEPALARRFLMSHDSSSVESAIGEALRFEKIVVSVSFAMAWATLLLLVFVCFRTLGWQGFIPSAIVILAFLFHFGRASIGRQSLVGVLGFQVVCMALPRITELGAFSSILPFLPWPFLLTRFMYWNATHLLRLLVIRNERAFDLLRGTIAFVKPTGS